MSRAVALLEFESTAVGILATDRMVKKAPVSLLRCGTVQPGRYLALVGGTVGATEEAHAAGVAVGREAGALVSDICLANPHPALAESLVGGKHEPEGDTLGVLEFSTSPGLLAVIDRVLKRVPVGLAEARLADDLGGKALALIHGDLPDVQEAVALAPECLPEGSALLQASIISRLDENLRTVLGEGTRFGSCRNWRPEGGEAVPEEED